jgi:hypothetical protein
MGVYETAKAVSLQFHCQSLEPAYVSLYVWDTENLYRLILQVICV